MPANSHAYATARNTSRLARYDLQSNGYSMKTTSVSVGALLVLAGIATCIFRPAEARPLQTQQQNEWEYATVEKTANAGSWLIVNGSIIANGDRSFLQLANDINRRLNARLNLDADGSDARGLILDYLGKDGWELVSSSYKLASSNGGNFWSTEVLHFKRPSQ